jgi:hypothetical protein
MRPLLPLLAVACAGPADPKAPACPEGDPDAPLGCSQPTLPEDHYVAAALAYFDTMDSRVPLETFPAYSERVVRWEWPPWLKLTAYTREVIELSDQLLRAYPSVVDDRDCRYFPDAPFARCRITFRYEAHDNLPCPIYEEFAFNEAGEITWIEAWSDQPALLPLDAADDPWAEDPAFPRLAARVPGLGSPSGLIDPDGDAMAAAAEADADVADLVRRMADFGGTWGAEAAAAGDEMWSVGCGW